MNATRTTSALLFLVLVVAAIDLVVHVLNQAPAPIALVSLPGFDPARADRVTLARPDRTLVFERRPDGWWIVAPNAARAHQPAVEELLAAVANGIEPEARVDDGDHARYGLAGGDELRVDVEGAGSTLLTFLVGRDSGGGSSWVRWAGSDAVYRARIGGRATFDRPAREWRDLQITRLDPAQLHTVRVRGTTRLGLVRQGAGWGHAWRDLDAPTLQQLVAGLAQLSALEVAAPGNVEGSLAVQLEGATLDPVVLTFEQAGDLWFVSRQDRQDRWRIAADLPELLLAAPDSLVNRALWPQSEVAVVRIERVVGARRTVLVQGEAGWIRVTPAGEVPLDATRASAAAVWLTGPRVTAWAEGVPRSHGYPGSERWEVRFSDGRVRTLELGGPARLDGQGHVAVRDRRRLRRIGWVDARVVQSIRTLFGD